MNCLLLLIILFCCGGNGSGCGHSHEHTCDNVNRCNMRNRSEVRNYPERNDKECGCHYENDSNNNSCHTPPPMPRAQFPYLDVEPRTCGCEEKSNS